MNSIISSQAFEIIALAPAGWAHPGVAVAAARAGGVGLLDLEFCTDEARALANFRRLLATTDGRVGVQATAVHLPLLEQLIGIAGERPLTLVLAQRGGSLSGAESLCRGGQNRLLIEVTATDDLDNLSLTPDGIIAKGHESPGWVGEDSSYILVQKLLRKTRLPIYVRGGVGINTAAGCRAAGVAGVVLDDQLLLMDGSALSDTTKTELARLVGAETRLFGELLGSCCRVYAKPAAVALKQADADNRAAEAGTMSLEVWRSAMNACVGWEDNSLMPVGQGIGAGAIYRERYRRVGKLVQALRKISFEQMRQAAELGHLAEGSPLAASQNTRYPLAQGPMTRVSDSPAFAASVTENGALPFLALALMRGDQVLEMLQETARLAGDKVWGVGMLGFIPQALRDEQCEAIWKCKPPYALIAGGRPDQAAAFEQRGIKTYIHAPAPALLKMYLEQGARRFVFEGRECGGHIGPITSFPLWEQMIEVLLAVVTPGTESDVHLLFAGGISDARSGAMLAALTAPLAARGMKVGALMGTAYLFTHEIVSSGAIVQGFQDQAVLCARTVNLETGPGHATRCADTKFAHDFFDARRSLMRENRSADEIRDTLEDLNLGRLRIASKGKNRDESGKIVDIAAEQQLSDGMYMIGQVATLTDATMSVADLHSRVCSDSQELLANFDNVVQAKVEKAAPSDIAIVGIGVLLPKAPDLESYWDNVLGKVSAITEVPRERWDWRLYYDADRTARDKIYSKWGGFLDEVMFDPTRFGIPPNSMKAIDPMQLLTLETVNRAVEDAGLTDFDREHTSIILGASGGAGDLGLQYGVRSELPRFVSDMNDGAFERLPEWTNESFAGVLLNVTAGRVANRLDFGGLNFTVDAACASSLAALSMAVNELETGRSNVAIAGGVDTVQSPYGFMCFSKTGALSPNGVSKAFDKKADGIVISEGVSMVVLKRLADAEAAGDRIYAVIKAVAGSSDGKALGMTAPRPDGQIRALNRAYGKAGFTPATLGMIEAHGTGTAVGDKAEAETITRALKSYGAEPNSVALGSVKTILGHTKASAGMAGLIKLAMSLYHRVQPAHANVDDPLDAITDPTSAAFILKQPRPWLASPDGTPRRGGVSAFGFGGTNFHAVVEEYRDGMSNPEINGSRNWTQELCVFRAADAAALRTDVERVLAMMQQKGRLKLAVLARGLAREADRRRGAKVCLALAARSMAALTTDLEAVLAHLATPSKPLAPNIKLALDRPNTAPQIAFVFPGQGSQYVDMGSEAAMFVDEMRSAIERADATLSSELPERLSRRIWPESAFNAETEAAQQMRLTDTRYAQPAIGALEVGYLNLARRLGLKAVAAAGHSYGEFAALHAAGVIDEASFLKLSAVRGRVMAEAASSGTPGGMAAVQAARDLVLSKISPFAGVVVANHNAPEQTVISGPAAQIEKAVEAISSAGLRVTRLPVSGAFHTELMAAAKGPLSAAIASTVFAEPTLAVYSNGSGAKYPAGLDAMRAQLDAHLLSSVEFVTEVQNLYADGVRLFLELGPKSICSNMIAATLAGRDARSVSLDGQGGGLRGLLSGLADLLALGVDFEVSRLFDGRTVEALSLAQLAERAQPAKIPATAWYISGGYVRPHADPILRTGQMPPMTLEKTIEVKQAVVQKILDAAPKPAPNIVHVPAPVAAQPAAYVSQPMAMPAAHSGEALMAYHETMRQFLSLQERVISQFLGAPGQAVPQAVPAPAYLPQMPTPVVAVAPVAAAPAVVAAPPVAAPAASGLNAAALSAMLLRIVADRTGYPEDMLALDADLEAELGIDSIKRVEIAGSLQKSLPVELGAAMQAQMERYTRAKTLNAILQPLIELAASAAPVIVAAPATVVATVTAAVPAIEIQPLLLKLVADRTGYPEDMLSLDADLEADLGIDSIKRVEIVGAFQKALPASISEALQAQMEKLTRAKTLRTIVDLVQPLVVVSAAPVAVAASVAASTAPPAVDYKTVLLEIVADRTGYPAEMLALDADLEADLGIDSIKRVEIVGALQKKLPTETAAAMQAAMESYTRAKTLASILDSLSKLGGGVSAPAAGPVIVAAAPVTVAAIDYRSLLLDIVADRTGYPAEMLALDADLEADLGIDSIKRVEIVGALQKKLPEATAAAMQTAMESYTRAKTLAAILQQLGSAAAPVAAAPAVTTSVAAAPTVIAAPVVVSDVPRYVIRPRPAPLTSKRVTLSGAVIVAGGCDAIVLQLLANLQKANLKPLRIDAIDAAGIEAGIKAAQAAHGSIKGVIHLHGLAEDEPETLAAWQQLGERSVLSLFRLLKPFGASLADMRVIAASRLGGTFGRDAVGPGTPLAGGINGLLNCVRDEYPSATLRAVDFNGQTDDTIASHLLDELLADDRAPEAGHTGDARYSVSTVEEALADTAFAPHLQPAADWVVVATGGARGITAELLEEMAVPGISFVLLGRTPEPAPEAAETAIAADTAGLKKVLLAQARARGETPKPVDIERALSRLLTEREIRGNLDRLRARGANVGYFSCDVRDEAAFGGVIDGIYQHYGRIDAVLHGAGVIEDRRIADKTDESFARVFNTKLDSSYILSKKLRPESLKLLVFFTSVAGRYGNKGQIDYASANEACNRLAWTLSRRWPETRVIAANWGPWDAGMASEAVKRQFRERGIDPIPVAGGRRYFLRELACGPKHEVEIVIGRGPWQSMEASDAPEAVAAGSSLYPLVRGPLRMGAGGALVLTHRFGLDSDPYLGDHVIDGRPVLPAAAATEWVAQMVGQGWPGWQVAEVQDLRTLAGVVLEPGATREIEIRAKATSHSGPGEQTVTVDIADPSRKAPLYRASVRLVERLEAPVIEVPPAISGQRMDPTQTYERMLFHTGRFRLLTDITAVAPEGVDAMVSVSNLRDWIGVDGDWLFDPGLIDVAAQLAWIWGRVHRQQSALPSRFGRVLRVPALPAPSGPLTLRFRIKAAAHEQAVAYDAVFTDAEGRVRLAMLDAESTLSAALNRIGTENAQ
ncbi:MAG: family NAD(P)-dependent oxidoreductase [Hydrocarboniphaga sp.]|uniref:type I polyketide synthase n=1 Tax=Hydrocarboniphaga sp. TaxID=2033016 RepID=UPI0026220A7E|nr:type I polyketide synthase [Hydrocarboniphaga sp.]MDB5969787.1 family NAD(P)-dependent oxidoreductase [Hydrocarboniphaga sp.]